MDKGHELQLLEELLKKNATDIYVYGHSSREDSRNKMTIVEDKVTYKVGKVCFTRSRREEIPFDKNDHANHSIEWKVPRPVSSMVFGSCRRHRARLDSKENRAKLELGIDYVPPKQLGLFAEAPSGGCTQ